MRRTYYFPEEFGLYAGMGGEEWPGRESIPGPSLVEIIIRGGGVFRCERGLGDEEYSFAGTPRPFLAQIYCCTAKA